MVTDAQVVDGQAIRIIAVSVGLCLLAISSVFLRFLARTYKNSTYYLDDYLLVVGMILTFGITITNIVGVAIAGLGENEIYRETGPTNIIGLPQATALRRQGKVMFTLQVLHTCAMPVIKASVLAFYLRLFSTHRFRIAVYVVSALIFCWWISVLIATIFQCPRISYNWATTVDQLERCPNSVQTLYQVAAITNMLGDVAVLTLPVPVIVGIVMPMKDMFAVLGIFLSGAFVVVAGIGRTIAYFQLPHNDQNDNFSYWFYPLVVWTQVEACLGVISACLPTLRPLFSRPSPESVVSPTVATLSNHTLPKNSSNAEDYKILPSGGTPVFAMANTDDQGGRSFRLPISETGRRASQHVEMELSLMRKDMIGKCIGVEGISNKQARRADDWV